MLSATFALSEVQGRTFLYGSEGEGGSTLQLMLQPLLEENLKVRECFWVSHTEDVGLCVEVNFFGLQTICILSNSQVTELSLDWLQTHAVICHAAAMMKAELEIAAIMTTL